MTHGWRWTLVAGACLCFAVSAFAQTSPVRDTRSLGDIARELRDKKNLDVQVTSEDAQRLFAAVDEILKFASSDTGFPKRTWVKRQLVSRDKVHSEFEEAFNDREEKERLLRSELVLKKFGLLPPAYNLQAELLKAPEKDIAGYYNSKKKTMYLVDWVPIDEQRPVMAHELTHALQDQNYDLLRFAKPGAAAQNSPKLTVPADDASERATVRRAIVEGQAMVVYMDYLGKPEGLTLLNSREAMAAVLSGLRSYDAPFVLHDAPWVLQETSIFPYRDGFAFEVEVLQKRGRDEAFAGVFARPPRSTHEILEPEAYLTHAPVPVVTIPDLRPLLRDAYEPYDAGSLGELDVNIMAKEFGRENDIFTVGRRWNGGAYVVAKRAGAAPSPTTADLALLYVSHWKSFEAAKRFAQIYQRALPKRVRVLQESSPTWKCAEGVHCKSPVWSARVATSEGPVFLEIWPGNTLLITHGFEEATVSQLRQAVLFPAKGVQRPPAPTRELSMSLYESPTFVALQERMAREILAGLSPRP